MVIEIEIDKYLTDEDIVGIIKEEVRSHVSQSIGKTVLSIDNSRGLMTIVAKTLAKDEIQKMIPNFKELINEHIVTEIGKIKLEDMFMQTMGWRSEGNKILNQVLTDNKPLIDAKVKELFKPTFQNSDDEKENRSQ